MKLEEAKSYLRTFIKVNNSIIKKAKNDGDTDVMEQVADLETLNQAIETVLKALENSIPTNKIEDKIKTNSLMNLAVTSNPILDKRSRAIQQAKIQVLQELLEDK